MMRSGRSSPEEMEAWRQQLAMRYRKAFAKCKVNWLRVDFDPITPIYKEQKAEQKFLADYGFGITQTWRPNHHHISNDNSEPERQKIIEEERQKREKLGVTVFGSMTPAKKQIRSNKPRTTHRNPIKKRTYRD